MREFNASVEGSVLISVRFKAELLIRADQDASIEKAIRTWANGKNYPKGDIEDATLVEVLEVGGEPVADFDLNSAVAAALESGMGGIKIDDFSFSVTDCR